MAKVSVIVPVYNVEKYVAKCLTSIQAQTFSDFECLVINDGTKDNSVKVAKAAVKGDKRFKFFNKENGGLSDARNFGIARAKSEYLCLIDSDDYVDPKFLELTYKAGVKNKSDIVCFDMYYAYEDGRLVYSWGADFNGTRSFKDNKSVIFINNSANNKLYKTSFIKDKKFIKGMWYEDMAVIPIWMAKANNITHVAKPLYYYVQREGSITHDADERIFDIYKAVAKVKEGLFLGTYEVKNLYFENCLIMTTLRIRDFKDKDTRLQYFKKNIVLLDEVYPNWYSDVLKEDYNHKQKIIFSLLHYHMFNLVEKAYRK